MGKKSEKPAIYLYYDYRQYLGDLFAFCKKRSKAFSHRYINAKAGFKSPNALKNVIDGKKHLSILGAERYADAFKLDSGERQYFLTLVKFNLARSLQEREKLYFELIRMRKIEAPALLAEDYFDVFTHWWNLVIREIISLPDCRNSSKWVGRILQPSISGKEAAKSIRLLANLGLIERKGKGWRPVYQTMKTDARVRSVKAANFHREMIRLGGEAITRFGPDEREISGTTIRIARKDLPALVKLLQDFRRQVLDFAAGSERADQVYQLNFQLFPLVRTSRPQRLK